MALVSPTRATHFFQTRLRAPDKSKQKRLPHHPALRCAAGDSRCSPFGPAYGCYSASLRFPRSGAVAGARHEGASCPSRLARRPASQPQPRHRNSASLTGTGRQTEASIFTVSVAWKTAQRFPLAALNHRSPGPWNSAFIAAMGRSYRSRIPRRSGRYGAPAWPRFQRCQGVAAFSTSELGLEQWTRLRRCPRYGLRTAYLGWVERSEAQRRQG